MKSHTTLSTFSKMCIRDSYYTNKNISVSYLRAKKKNDLDRIMGLYLSLIHISS